MTLRRSCDEDINRRYDPLSDAKTITLGKKKDTAKSHAGLQR